MGILSKLFGKNPEKRKILSNFDMQDLIEGNQNQNLAWLRANDERLFNLEAKINSNIPEEYAELITQINGSVGGLSVPDEDIYRIIKAYQKIKSDEFAEFVSPLTSDMVDNHNKTCYKCGAEVVEGSFYKVGDGRIACLSHLKEAEPINKGVKKNAGKKSKLHGKRNDNSKTL